LPIIEYCLLLNIAYHWILLIIEYCQVDFIFEWFAGSLEHLSLRHCPIALSSALLRGYLIAALPLLRTFNDEPVGLRGRGGLG